MAKKKGPPPLPLFDSLNGSAPNGAPPPGPPPPPIPPAPPATPSGYSLTGDITRNRHRDNPESIEAYESLEPGSLARMRGEIYVWVRARGYPRGATGDEIQIATGYLHQTTSARISELRKLGYLVPTAERRPTRSGRNARVLVAYELLGPEYQGPGGPGSAAPPTE